MPVLELCNLGTLFFEWGILQGDRCGLLSSWASSPEAWAHWALVKFHPSSLCPPLSLWGDKESEYLSYRPLGQASAGRLYPLSCIPFDPSRLPITQRRRVFLIGLAASPRDRVCGGTGVIPEAILKVYLDHARSVSYCRRGHCQAGAQGLARTSQMREVIP